MDFQTQENRKCMFDWSTFTPEIEAMGVLRTLDFKKRMNEWMNESVYSLK